MICGGVLSEIRLLESMHIEEYASTLNAWKHELALKQDAVKNQ